MALSFHPSKADDEAENGAGLRYAGGVMSTTEILTELPRLSTKELEELAAAVDRLFRERKGALIYADAYGVGTEADLVVAADQAFVQYDREEEQRAKRQTR